MSIEKVGFRLEVKNPGDVQYSSFSEGAWFETVVRDGETVEQAFQRAKSVVRAQISEATPVAQYPESNERRSGAFEPGTGKFKGFTPRRPQDDAPGFAPNALFDAGNPAHRREAERWFERYGVKSEASKDYKLRRIEGLSFHAAEEWIEKDQNEFRNRSRVGRSSFGRYR